MNSATPCHRYVLVVEDDQATREALLAVLHARGFAAIGAADGREALDHLHEHPLPCLILLDLMMPVMNGWEFRQHQRNDSRLAAIPVLVLSADSNLNQKPAALEV